MRGRPMRVWRGKGVMGTRREVRHLFCGGWAYPGLGEAISTCLDHLHSGGLQQKFVHGVSFLLARLNRPSVQ